MNYEEKIKLREKCNAVLTNYMVLYMLLYPELRFIQLLQATKIIDSEDRFYEEPYDTVIRVLPSINEALQNSKGDELIKGWIITDLKEMNLI